MKNLAATLTLTLFFSVLPSSAGPFSSAASSQFHWAVDHSIRKVQSERDPQAKREILGEVLSRLQKGIEQAGLEPSIEEGERGRLLILQRKIADYRDELAGENGFSPVADRDLDAFAHYVQQDMEQAAIGGGIYLSATTILIILALLVLLT